MLRLKDVSLAEQRIVTDLVCHDDVLLADIATVLAAHILHLFLNALDRVAFIL